MCHSRIARPDGAEARHCRWRATAGCVSLSLGVKLGLVGRELPDDTCDSLELREDVARGMGVHLQQRPERTQPSPTGQNCVALTTGHCFFSPCACSRAHSWARTVAGAGVAVQEQRDPTCEATE